MIVLVCTAFFVVSLLCGTSRGLVLRYWRRWQLQRVVDRQHVLRAIYETLEAAGTHRLKPAPAVPVQQLREARSWSWPRLSGEFVRAERAGLLVQTGEQVALTARGMVEAERLTRQHRLWELYLITHADVAPGRVDRDADAIEHVLEPEIVAELEALLDGDRATLPASPHAMPGARGDAFSPSAPQGS
jgi:manganese/zinc/iron transport system permease protein